LVFSVLNVYSIKHLALKHLKHCCRHANILTRGHRSVEVLLQIKEHKWKADHLVPSGFLQPCKTVDFSASFSWSYPEV